MISDEFEAAFKYLLDNDEGRKYVDNPKDSGGATKFGITKKVYEIFYQKQVSNFEIENMTEDEAKTIYAANYWVPLRLGELKNKAIQISLFSCAVLFGQGTTVIMLQKALNECSFSLTVDGLVGALTILDLNSADPFAFITEFRDQLLKRIEVITEANPNDLEFKQGWINRADRFFTLVEQFKKEPIV